MEWDLAAVGVLVPKKCRLTSMLELGRRALNESTKRSFALSPA